MSTNQSRVGLGGAATLSCAVTRGNPMAYTYSWSLAGNTIPGETSATLSLSAFTMADAGTYTCMVTNDAGIGMGSSIIELGGEEEYR